MSSKNSNAPLADAARHATRYLDPFDTRPVFPDAADVARLEAALDHAMPDEPADAADVLAFIDDVGSPATVASAGARYFGLVTGGALPASLAAN